jgi:multiple sugar transport system permease protein
VRHAGRGPQRGVRAFLLVVALVWLFPVGWAVYTSLRPYAETAARGYVSWPASLTLDNYATAWREADLPHYVWNSLVVAVPSVVLVLLLAAMIAFAVSRFSWRFNLAALLLLTAGNLLPPQVVVVPLFRLFLALPLPGPLTDNGVAYDQLAGLVLVHVAFQLGFCAFVLSAWMKTLPREVLDAALVDGASLLRTFRSVVLPLSRPPLAALAVLEFTWIYNDFFWALTLIRTGAKRPVTAALQNLAGQYFTDTNLLAAAAVLAALPTLVVLVALQRHFVRGLTLGASRG